LFGKYTNNYSSFEKIIPKIIYTHSRKEHDRYQEAPQGFNVNMPY